MTRENDISTQEKIPQEGPWISEKNEYKRRQESTGCKKVKRKKEIVSLGHINCGLSSYLIGKAVLLWSVKVRGFPIR